MNDDRFKKWVCTAIDMEEKGRTFYQQALDKCSEGPARQIFAMLRDDEAVHIQRIRDIEKALDSGSDPEASCSLPEVSTEAAAVFKRLARESQARGSCPEIQQALSTGMDFELTLADFYQQALDSAEGDFEKMFLKRMVEEEKGHYVLLKDMQYFYEDPEGWALEQDNAGLDGA
ncbi:MAG: ferritin family protein [Desulfonatronovibrionaceae bacterium]